MKRFLPIIVALMLLLCSCAKLSPNLNVKLLEGDTSKSAKHLVSAVDNEKYPVKVKVTLEENGVKSEAESTDSSVIMSLFDKLNNITINKQTDDSVKDSKQKITFILKDDTECSFKFEGEKLFMLKNIHYEISDYQEFFDEFNKLLSE